MYSPNECRTSSEEVPSISQLAAEVRVWIVDLQAAQDLVDRAALMLSIDEQERAARCKVQSSRREFVLSRSILRLLLSRLLGAYPAYLEFGYNQYGKPRLLSETRPIRFNLSHSGGLVAYAVTLGCEVGIDIEPLRPVTDLEIIAERFFSQGECSELSALPEDQRTLAFLSCWVRKEAYLKAVGQGLSIDPASFRVTVFPGSSGALMSVNGDDCEGARWTLQDFVPAPGYVGTVAFRDTRRAVHVHPRQDAAAMVQAWADPTPVE